MGRLWKERPDYGSKLFRASPDLEVLDYLFLVGILLVVVFVASTVSFFCLSLLVLLILGGLLLCKIKQRKFFNTFFIYQEAVEVRPLGFTPWGAGSWKAVPFQHLSGILQDFEKDFEFDPYTGELILFRTEGLMLLTDRNCYQLPLHLVSPDTASKFRNILEDELGDDYRELLIDPKRPELPPALAAKLGFILGTGPESAIHRFLAGAFSVLLGIFGLSILLASQDIVYPSMFFDLLFLVLLSLFTQIFWDRSTALDHQRHWARLYLILCLARDAREGTGMVTGELKKYIPYLTGILAQGNGRPENIDFKRINVEID